MDFAIIFFSRPKFKAKLRRARAVIQARSLRSPLMRCRRIDSFRAGSLLDRCLFQPATRHPYAFGQASAREEVLLFREHFAVLGQTHQPAKSFQLAFAWANGSALRLLEAASTSLSITAKAGSASRVLKVLGKLSTRSKSYRVKSYH